MKHLMLFEDFNMTDEALTKGQMAAQSAGKNLLNKGQAAVAYILAMEKISSANATSDKDLNKKLYDKYGSINNLMTEAFGFEWKSGDFGRWLKNLNLKGDEQDEPDVARTI
jgi:hypothetical protein